jgi:uncharacterized membrane protein
MEALYETLRSIGYTHPLHPPMTYLPLGMVIGSLLFSLISVFPRCGKFSVTARHCITLGFVGVFPTMLLGYLDWQYFYGGRLILPIQMKLILAAVLTLLLSLAVVLYWKLPAQDKRIFAVHLLCFATIVGIGFFGGELVFGRFSPDRVETAAAAKRDQASPADRLTFADVAPILNQYCTSCHAGSHAPEGLQLDSHEAVMTGGPNGPVVVAGKPGESELVKRIRGEVEPGMPYRQPPLSSDKIQRIVEWVRQGAR